MPGGLTDTGYFLLSNYDFEREKALRSLVKYSRFTRPRLSWIFPEMDSSSTEHELQGHYSRVLKGD